MMMTCIDIDIDKRLFHLVSNKSQLKTGQAKKKNTLWQGNLKKLVKYPFYPT